MSTKATDTFSSRDKGKGKIDVNEGDEKILKDCGGISDILKRLQGRNDLSQIVGKLKDAELIEPMISSPAENEPVTHNTVHDLDKNTECMHTDSVQMASEFNTAPG